MSCFYKFRDICWNGFLQVVTCTTPQVSFVWFKKVIMWWWISWSLMGESLRSGKLLYSMLSFTLSSKIESKICHREEFNWCKIHHVNKICLKLNILEKFATDVLCTNCGHPCQDDVCHHATIILESCKWDQQNVKWPKKIPFQDQTSGLSSMYMYLSATMASLSSLYALRTSALWRSVDMLWISKTCS